MELTHEDMLMRWLRTKHYHVNDIAVALNWYRAELETGMTPSDQLVRDIAEECHLKAVKASRNKIVPLKVSIKYRTNIKLISYSVISGIFGALIFHLIIYKNEIWQALAQMR